MLNTVLQTIATAFGLNFMIVTKDSAEQLLSAACTFPVLALYPEQINFTFTDSGRAAHEYRFTVDVLYRHKHLADGRIDQLQDYLNNAKMKADEVKHALNANDVTDVFSGNMVQVLDAAETLFKNSAPPLVDGNLVGWSIRGTLRTKYEAEIDLCTGASTGTAETVKC